MNTFTIEELDREEVEFLPPRVVMIAACSPRTLCPPQCLPQPCIPECKTGVVIHLRLHLSLCCNGGGMENGIS
jgi:hypothetical protein